MWLKLLKLYDAYVDTFRAADGQLPVMMNLKRIHTDEVVRNAMQIVEGERFPPHLVSLARMAALLHDTGRYEQLKTYDTFKDSDSIDHAVLSHRIVETRGWLSEIGLSAEEIEIVLKAVLYHNRRELPLDLPESLVQVANVVRDADKLDIFRVLEDQIQHADWRHDSRAFWNLAVRARPNPVVVEAIEAGKPVDYQSIQGLSDFVLIQVGWMISGLAFSTTRQLCRARNHLEFRRAFLHQLTDDPAIDRLCDLAVARQNSL